MVNSMQLGTAVETTYGTPVTVERFHEFLGGESLERQQNVIMPDGLRPGLRTKLGTRRTLVRKWGEGTIPMEITTTGFGRWFKHALGVGTVTQEGTSTAWTHVYSPADLAGLSLTIQKGVEPWTAAGTALPFTFQGCKITGWEMGISTDGFALFAVDIDAEDVETTTALAVASYNTLKNFSFLQGALTIGDTSSSLSTLAGVSDFTLRGQNALKIDRWFLNASNLKKEPLENGFREYSGALTMEFVSQTDIYDAFESDTEKHLRLVFTGDTIAGTFTELLQIDLFDVRFEGETPKISGPEPAVVSADFSGWEQANGKSIQITYVTTDVAV